MNRCSFGKQWHQLDHTHTRLKAPFPGLPRWASTRKAKPIWISLKEETVSGSAINWATCIWAVGYWHGYLSGARCRLAYGINWTIWKQSAPCSRQTTTSSLKFLQAGCSSWCPTNSVKAPRHNYNQVDICGAWYVHIICVCMTVCALSGVRYHRSVDVELTALLFSAVFSKHSSSHST